MKTIRFGVLGAATILRRYMGDAIKAAPGSELACIASRDVTRASALAEGFGCDVEADYDSVLARPDVDAVYVPLPVALHEEWCIRAAEAGKHVLSEKALSHDFDSCRRIIDAARAHKVLLTENFMCDFHTQHAEVLRRVDNGAIGEIQLFTAKFGFPPLQPEDIRYSKELGGGALNDNGTYVIFMARKIYGAEPIEVKALSRPKDGVDDTGAIFMVFPGARVAHLSYGFSFDYQNNYEIWGSEGTIRVDRAFSIPPDVKPNVQVMKNNDIERLDLAPCNHFVELLNDFNRAVADGRDFTPYYEKLERQAAAMKMVRGY